MVTTEELLKLLKEIAEERIPFNKVLGLTVQTMDEEHMQENSICVMNWLATSCEEISMGE